jgi:hypothetical protein
MKILDVVCGGFMMLHQNHAHGILEAIHLDLKGLLETIGCQVRRELEQSQSRG